MVQGVRHGAEHVRLDNRADAADVESLAAESAQLCAWPESNR